MAELRKNYCQKTEEELALLAKQGDSSAASELVLRLYMLVYFTVDNFSAQGIEKADLIQEGMIGLLNALHSFNPKYKTSFKTYARSCIINHLSTVSRKLTQKKQIPQDKLVSISKNEIYDFELSPEEKYIENERFSEINNSLKSKLSNFEYEILQKYLSGYSAAEIAEIFSIDVKSVSNGLYRIRQKFHSIIK